MGKLIPCLLENKKKGRRKKISPHELSHLQQYTKSTRGTYAIRIAGAEKLTPTATLTVHPLLLPALHCFGDVSVTTTQYSLLCLLMFLYLT